MKKFFISLFALLLCLFIICVSFTSCNSCGGAERFVSDIGYGDWDFDGDGVSGREVSFKGGGVRIQNSCNIRRHDCDYGIDIDYNGYCDNCENNGYSCSMANHVN